MLLREQCCVHILTAEPSWPPSKVHFLLFVINPFMLHKEKSMQASTICCEFTALQWEQLSDSLRNTGTNIPWNQKHVFLSQPGRRCVHSPGVISTGAGKAKPKGSKAMWFGCQRRWQLHRGCWSTTLCLSSVSILREQAKEQPKKKWKGGKSNC